MDIAMSMYNPPFCYHLGYIFDASGHMVADECGSNAALRLRGWGRIQYQNDSEALQDAIGDHIAKALTEYWKRHG